jgi:hypothetical protein
MIRLLKAMPRPGTQPLARIPRRRPRGHSPAEGTHRLHTTPPGQKALYKYCTQWLHQQLTQTAADGWPRRDDLSTIPGDTALLRAHSQTQGTHTAGTQRPAPGPNSKNRTGPRGHTACHGDTPPAHNAPRTESTAQMLYIIVASTVVTVRPEGWPRRDDLPDKSHASPRDTALGTRDAPGDTALLRGHRHTRGTQTHSGHTAALGVHTATLGGHTAALGGHTLPAPNAPPGLNSKNRT